MALISIFIAVSALAYNTWRNETTEEQRNIRHAAFRVLEDLGEVQEIESPCAMSITRQRLKKLAYMANSGGIARYHGVRQVGYWKLVKLPTDRCPSCLNDFGQ